MQINAIHPSPKDLVAALVRGPGVFVTAVDTGVGKTTLGATLIRAVRERQPDRRLIVRKPAESGCPPLTLERDPNRLWSQAKIGCDYFPEDAARLAEAAGYTGQVIAAGSDGDPDLTQPEFATQQLANKSAIAAVCPFRFAAAIAPDQAAIQTGQTLPLSALIEACQHGVMPGDYVHVEGAGGYYSPIATDGALNADLADSLAERLALPVLLVAPDRLGVQSAVLLAVEAMQRRRARMLGVLLNSWFHSPQTPSGVPHPKNQFARVALAATQGPDNLNVLRSRLDVPVWTSDDLST
ncbi:MAG: ATP-dependent dethiobiotin synthetase BioD [Thioalkalivibrionaceae bacterium]